jgi:hypothetical protein
MGQQLADHAGALGGQRIAVCSPWCNGRIERLFGTLKPLLRQLVIPSKAALQLALQEFTLFYSIYSTLAQ